MQLSETQSLCWRCNAAEWARAGRLPWGRHTIKLLNTHKQEYLCKNSERFTRKGRRARGLFLLSWLWKTQDSYYGCLLTRNIVNQSPIKCDEWVPGSDSLISTRRGQARPNRQSKMQSLWANCINVDIWLNVIKSTKHGMTVFNRDLKEGT